MFEALEQLHVVNDSVFDDFSQTGAILAHGQCPKRFEVAQHEARLIKRAHQILACFQIDADLAADRAVHLREQCRRDLHEIDAAQESRRHEAGEVSHHAAAKCDDKGLPFEALFGELGVTRGYHLKALGRFTCRNSD